MNSVLLALLLITALLARPASAQEAASPAQDGDAQAAADLELVSALERVVSRAIARAERSVVSIARRKRASTVNLADSHPGAFLRSAGPDASTPFDPNFAPSEFASGVVIDARGLVLTNRHVLGDKPEENDFFVTTIDRKVFAMKVADRKATPMKIKASDGPSDLAVLEPVQPAGPRTGDFVPIDFGDASTLRKGQLVIALGNPYGIARDGQASASWGIVANLSRKAASSAEEEGQKTLHDFGTLIQTDAKLNLGTSGGALLNIRGEMVGLTTSLAATSGFEQPAGYAIPVDKAFLRIIQALKEGREVEYGLLGIVPHNWPRDQMNQGTPGIVVGNVVPGGPASKAKLRQKDIITHVDGKIIYDDDALRLHVSKLAPDTVTTLTVIRPPDNKSMQRRVVLAKLSVGLPQTFTARPPSWRGATIDYRKPKTGVPRVPMMLAMEDFSVPCVSVREVEEGSPAWSAGLRQGMLITHVAKTPVETPNEFRKAVDSQTGPVKLQLLTAEGDKETVTVPPQ
jgi:serine protease Do